MQEEEQLGVQSNYDLDVWKDNVTLRERADHQLIKYTVTVETLNAMLKIIVLH